MDCVKKYKDENNIKGKKHEEGNVRGEKSPEKQSKQKKNTWNDTRRDKGKRGIYSGVTPAGGKKRLSRQMTKQYNRSGVERSILSRWYAWWEKSSHFEVGSSSSKPPFFTGDELDESGWSEWFLKNQLGRHSGKVVVRPTKAGSSIGVTVAYGVTDTLEKTKEILTECIDDKIIVELVLEGRKEFTAIVLDVGSGFYCHPVMLLPTEVELQFHGSTDLAEKDAIFNYRRKYLSKKQISCMDQTSFLFQQASKVGFSHSNMLRTIIRHACSRFPAINSCNITSSAENLKTSSVDDVQKAFVIFGGDSSELQVSLMSGTNVCLNLQASDDGRDVIWNGKSRWVEITVGVVGKHGSMQPLTPSIAVKESGDILSLEEKFQGGTGFNLTPQPISILSKDSLANCKRHTELIANTLQLEGFSRIDAFVNVDTGEVLIEVNTVPGMTPSTVLIHQDQAMAEQPPAYSHHS